MRTIVIPLVVTSAAWGVELLLRTTVGITPLIVFHGATAAATWLAGPLAGFLSALVGFVVSERYFFSNSLYQALATRSVVQALVYWIAEATLIIGLSVLRAALARASRGARRAERLASRVRRRNAESRRTAARYRALSEMTAALLPALTRAQVRDLVLARGVVVADATAGILVIQDGERLEVNCGGDCPEGMADAIAGSQPVTESLSDGRTRWVGVQEFPAMVAERSASDLWAVLPLSTRERRIGVLLLGYTLSGALTESYRPIAELLAQQCAQALERARLYQTERSLRIESQFNERQMAFLSSVSTALLTTLDTTRSLAEVADLAATNLGGFCAVHSVDPEGRIRLAASTLSTEAGLIRFDGENDHYVLSAISPIGYPAVIASGEAQLLPALDPHELDAAAAGPEHAARLAEMGLRSQICVPLIVRESTVGTITVATTEPGRRLGVAELHLVHHLARRVAQAVDAAHLYQAAVEASRAKSSFLAVMSHELRTPLNAILGYVDLILMGVPAEVSEETSHQVERIRYSAAHLLELVEDVLDFARIEAGRDRVQVEPVRIDQVVAETVGMIEPLARGKGLALRRAVPAGMTISTDRAKLVRILQNLLSNATKFTTAGSIEVEARQDGDKAVIDVRDTGIGIESEYVERVFDPFWQVEQTSTRRYGGTGIGLGIARQLARQLGGDLTVETEVDHGSTFTLRVPVRFGVALNETA